MWEDAPVGRLGPGDSGRSASSDIRIKRIYYPVIRADSVPGQLCVPGQASVPVQASGGV